ncbi:PD40 domain-containing protein [Actinomadura welshii]|uniref:nSTAND1 domain-containing NTPase n=1 Tax=Actinomadura welshii TaxID=3103817 RepID=UPI000467C462|nr:PD40 domain-containing protein [Actinomadura madurae]
MVRWTGSTGAQARRWSTPVLLSVLAAGAVGPLLTPVVGASAVASAGVGAVTAVGGNVLTDLVKAGIARLGGPDVQGSERDLESELERGVQRILETGGERAERLRGEIAELLREVGAVGAAIEAVLETGDRRLQTQLAAGLAAVGEEFGEFGFVLSELRVQLGLLREGIDRQGGRLRQQSAQLQLAVDLGYRQATDTRLLLEQVAAIERRTRPGRPPESGAAWSDGCPYRGLVAFSEADAGVFYGREVLTAQLVARLAQRLTSAGPLIVTGASGAGKSSLLRAGLLPAAGRGELSEAARQWPRHVLDRPTGSPLGRLAILVAGLAGLDAPGVLRSLTREPGQAHLLVRQALDADAGRRGLSGPAATGSRLILAVDQFEELFTLDVPDERRERAEVERDAFFTALHAAASAPAGPDGASAALVVIAVRGDFIDRCAQHPLLAAALQDGPFVVGPMAEADLRRAITGPADVAGLSIEPGLIDTILSPLRSPAGGYDAGALPLLSQAMLTIWEHREDDRLTGRGYALTGGVTQAVATSAEAAYADLDPGRQRLARHVFHRLTAVSRDGRLARRTVQRPDLHAGHSDRGRADSDRILDVFAARRLIVVDDSGVQIAHDVLLHAWPRLRGWLEADLSDHALYNQLVDAADEWAGHGRSASFLFRGERLAAVQSARIRWQADPGRFPDLTDTARLFLAAGARARIRGRRRRRAVLAAFSVLVVFALGLAATAVRSSVDARHQRDLAVSRQLIAQSRLQATDPALSALLAAAAWRIDPAPATRANLLFMLSRPERGVLTSRADSITAAELSPDGRTLALGTLNEVSFVDVRTRRHVGAPLTGLDGAVSASFSPDGRTLATSSGGDHRVLFWDARTRKQVGAPLPDHGNPVDAMVFHPDGRTLATSGDGMVRLWDARTHEQIGEDLTGRGEPASVAFSPDGRALATGTDGKVQIWDTRTRERIGAPLEVDYDSMPPTAVFSPSGNMLATGGKSVVRLWDSATHKPVGGPLTAHDGDVTSLAFSPDGRTLAIGDSGNTLRLWNVHTRRQLGEPFIGHTDSVTSIIFLNDGGTLVTGGTDGTVRLWNFTTHRQVGDPLAGHREEITSLALNRDGKTLATGSADRTVRFWDLHRRRQIALLERAHAESVRSVAFSLDGDTLATSGGNDKTVRLWDVRTRRQTGAPITGDYSGSVAFSPDGRTLAVVDGYSTVRLWDVRTWRQTGAPITGSGDYSGPVAFSPDGRTLATEGDGNSVRLFDSRTHRQIGAPFAGHEGIISSLAFSPDGRSLASGSLDGTVRLWDVRAHRQIGAALTGHTAYVGSIAFSHDGRALASGSGDGEIHLWDPETRTQISGPLTGHDGAVAAVLFGPDGRTLISGGADRTVRQWDVAAPRDPYAAVCAIAGRSLTAGEWARYVPGQRFRSVCP